ncbi:hypothetical protein JHK82_047500 [Glycine max]|uniref:Uncharacterized protein n=1 Tax=Glycine soja TaxID=3848 RepID=A0A445G6Q0_GLYSO|nr:hypothetical protein JHK87_047195 [Glycine soja]KAG5097646.1 hypothetical protein JHK82_047500 [Glycine max]KAH1118452.1 hypothetical protein GYH30_047278 [Glycine max]RZB56870.1 hypothetical protein D0Y65_045819 [Glycine soja]
MIFPATARSALSPSLQHFSAKVDGYGEEIDWKEEGWSDGYGKVKEAVEWMNKGGVRSYAQQKYGSLALMMRDYANNTNGDEAF